MVMHVSGKDPTLLALEMLGAGFDIHLRMDPSQGWRVEVRDRTTGTEYTTKAHADLGGAIWAAEHCQWNPPGTRPPPASATLTHAEVFSDGAVFYIGEIQRPGERVGLGIVEAHNLRTMGAVDASFGPGVADGSWVLVDLTHWPEDELYARYESDAQLVRVYERMQPREGEGHGAPPYDAATATGMYDHD